MCHHIRRNDRLTWWWLTVFIAALALGSSLRVVSATEPIVQCHDISEVMLSLEREPIQGDFHLPTDVRRFIDKSFGVDGNAVLANINAIADHLNTDPEKFRYFSRFRTIGDLVGGDGPIFLVGDSCVALCSAFVSQKADGVFSLQSTYVGRRYLSIQSISEDVRELKIILANQQGLASIEFTQRENVVGETFRLREYRVFGKASAWPDDRCLNVSNNFRIGR